MDFNGYILGFLKSSPFLSSYGGLLPKSDYVVLLKGDLLGTRTSVSSNKTQKMIRQNPGEIDGREIIENLLEGRWRRVAKYSLISKLFTLKLKPMLVKTDCNTYNSFSFAPLKILIVVITFLAPLITM